MGRLPVYHEAAQALARFMLERNLALVYGGANVGLMGILADTMLAGGGRVTGVMPDTLVEREVAHPSLTTMHIVNSMQERKRLMADLSDGFVTLPGAFGTFDELFEVLTWNQLGIITKPVGMLNVAGYFDPLLQMLRHAVDERYLRPEHHSVLLTDTTPSGLFTKMEAWRPVTAEKWIERLKNGEI